MADKIKDCVWNRSVSSYSDTLTDHWRYYFLVQQIYCCNFLEILISLFLLFKSSTTLIVKSSLSYVFRTWLEKNWKISPKFLCYFPRKMLHFIFKIYIRMALLMIYYHLYDHTKKFQCLLFTVKYLISFFSLISLYIRALFYVLLSVEASKKKNYIMFWTTISSTIKHINMYAKHKQHTTIQHTLLLLLLYWWKIGKHIMMMIRICKQNHLNHEMVCNYNFIFIHVQSISRYIFHIFIYPLQI